MPSPLNWIAGIFIVISVMLSSVNASAQLKIDIGSEDAKKASGQTSLDDLAVHETAFIYESFCLKDGGLYVPGWTVPANLASSDIYAASGLILRIEVLPGKKIRGNWVDAANAQLVAQGKLIESSMTKEEYSKEARLLISRIFSGFFGVINCDDEQRQNPLRPRLSNLKSGLLELGRSGIRAVPVDVDAV